MGAPSGSGRASGWGARVGASPHAIDVGVGMLCQCSRPYPVSSEKPEMVAEPGTEEELRMSRVVTVTVVVGGYRALPASLTSNQES